MNIGQAISTQTRIVYSVAAHDTKVKYAEAPFGIVSSLIEPLITLLIMNMIMYYVRARTPKMGDYLILMIATGLLPISCFRNSLNAGKKTLNKFRKLLVLPQLRPCDLILGGILANLVTLMVMFMIISMYFHIVIGTPEPEAPLMSLVPFICNAIIAFGFCVMNSVIETYFPFWRRIFALITSPLPICSGLFYTAETMPIQLRDFLYYNPFMHSTELCRTYFFPEYQSKFFDPWYYGAWVIGALFVGLALERIYRDRLTSSG